MSRLNQVDIAVLQRYLDSGERLAYRNYLKGTGPATTPARDALAAQRNVMMSSGNVLGLVEDVAARSPALGAVVRVIADIGENAFLDMLIGASQGRSMLGTTTDHLYVIGVEDMDTHTPLAELLTDAAGSDTVELQGPITILSGSNKGDLVVALDQTSSRCRCRSRMRRKIAERRACSQTRKISRASSTPCLEFFAPHLSEGEIE